MSLYVLVPKNRQRDVLAPELPIEHRPVWFRTATGARRQGAIAMKLRLQLLVGQGQRFPPDPGAEATSLQYTRSPQTGAPQTVGVLQP